MRKANDPFRFTAASYLTCIRHERAHTLQELADCLKTVSDSSIFYHTFQTLESHHYAAFSNDFSQWVLAACNEEILAERLGVIDIRDFHSLAELRAALVRLFDGHFEERPSSRSRVAFEPFYFCELREITLPLGRSATDLQELSDGIQTLSLQTLHHHFINSRMRPQFMTNDFSVWIEKELELPELARALNRIDFYTNTLEGVRLEIVATLRPWTHQ